MAIHPKSRDHAVQLVKVLAEEEEGGADPPSAQFWREKKTDAGQGEDHMNGAYHIRRDEGELGQREYIHGKQGQRSEDINAEGAYQKSLRMER